MIYIVITAIIFAIVGAICMLGGERVDVADTRDSQPLDDRAPGWALTRRDRAFLRHAERELRELEPELAVVKVN